MACLEGAMKLRTISLAFILINITTIVLNAQEAKIVAEYNVDNKLFMPYVAHPYEKRELEICFNNIGELYIADFTKLDLKKGESSDFKIVQTYNVRPYFIDGELYAYSDGILCFSHSGYFSFITFDGTVIFTDNLLEMGIKCDRFDGVIYYNKFLLFKDSSDTLNIHCILNPSMDHESNIKNYRNPEQTKELLRNKSDYDLNGLSMDDNGVMYLNNQKYYWYGKRIGKRAYQIVAYGKVSISDGKTNFKLLPPENDTLKYESVTIHPSGDVYYMIYDSSKKAHVLYSYTNTWDPEWRADWYKNNSN